MLCPKARAVTLYVLLLTAQQLLVRGDYEIRIGVHSYYNPSHRHAGGGCCDPTLSFSCRRNQCDNYFVFCLRPGDHSLSDHSCPLGVQHTGHVGADSLSFTPGEGVMIGLLPNPLRFPNPGTWPGSFQIQVFVYDRDDSFPRNINGDELVDFIPVDVDLSVSESFSDPRIYDGVYSRGRIELSLQVVCAHNYYGSDCATFCAPRNDRLGHYSCDSSGSRLCLAGYQNPNTNCTQTICNPTCNPTRGYCNSLRQCQCFEGWQGLQCSDCIPKPLCSPVGGYCTAPDECFCREGYTGAFCETELDICTRQADLCTNGGSCLSDGNGGYVCLCPVGYTGANCETRFDGCESSPCQNNGECVSMDSGIQCVCEEGFSGDRCEVIDSPPTTMETPTATSGTPTSVTSEGTNPTTTSTGEVPNTQARPTDDSENPTSTTASTSDDDSPSTTESSSDNDSENPTSTTESTSDDDSENPTSTTASTSDDDSENPTSTTASTSDDDSENPTSTTASTSDDDSENPTSTTESSSDDDSEDSASTTESTSDDDSENPTSTTESTSDDDSENPTSTTESTSDDDSENPTSTTASTSDDDSENPTSTTESTLDDDSEDSASTNSNTSEGPTDDDSEDTNSNTSRGPTDDDSEDTNSNTSEGPTDDDSENPTSTTESSTDDDSENPTSTTEGTDSSSGSSEPTSSANIVTAAQVEADDDEEGPNLGAILGPILGVILILVIFIVVIIILLLWWKLCRNKELFLRGARELLLESDSNEPPRPRSFHLGENPTYLPQTTGTHVALEQSGSINSVLHEVVNPLYTVTNSEEHIYDTLSGMSTDSRTGDEIYSRIDHGKKGNPLRLPPSSSTSPVVANGTYDYITSPGADEDNDCITEYFFMHESQSES